MRVWDLPTRLYHWIQATLFLGLVITGFKGASVHVLLGLLIFTLVIWRLLWGMVGSQTSQFKHFVCSPKVVLSYIKGQHPHRPGHNPAGGWMVVTMLLTLLLQCFSGLILADFITPLSMLAPELQALLFDIAAVVHVVTIRVLLALVALHLVAIVIYKLKSKPLVKAMVTGESGQSYTESVKFSSNRTAFVVLLCSFAITSLILMTSI